MALYKFRILLLLLEAANWLSLSNPTQPMDGPNPCPSLVWTRLLLESREIEYKCRDYTEPLAVDLMARRHVLLGVNSWSGQRERENGWQFTPSASVRQIHQSQQTRYQSKLRQSRQMSVARSTHAWTDAGVYCAASQFQPVTAQLDNDVWANSGSRNVSQRKWNDVGGMFSGERSALGLQWRQEIIKWRSLSLHRHTTTAVIDDDLLS